MKTTVDHLGWLRDAVGAIEVGFGALWVDLGWFSGGAARFGVIWDDAG